MTNFRYIDLQILWHLIDGMELHALIKGNVYIFYSHAMTFFGYRRIHLFIRLITLFSFWDPNISTLQQKLQFQNGIVIDLEF